MILIWSFYPGALASAVLFRWCFAKQRAGAWGGWSAVRAFAIGSLATAPIPAMIHAVIISLNQASRSGPFASIGEGSIFVLFLPFVSAGLSVLGAVVLAGMIGDKEIGRDG